MRMLALAAAAAALVPAALVSAPALQARERAGGEERLARLLEGRVAGEPVDCISLSQSRDTKVIDGTAIVYGHGNTLYVNRPRHPRGLDSDDILVTELRGTSRLCRLDTVRLHDRSGGWFTGFVGLEQFVPYRRVARRD